MDSVHLPRRLLLAGIGSAALATVAGCESQSPGATPATPRPTTTARPSRTAARGGEAALRRKIASLLVVGFRGDRVSDRDWIVKAVRGGLGGVILFDQDLETKSVRNIRSPEQVTRLVKSLKDASPGRLIVSIDQEGGRTSRLNRSNGFPATRSEAEIGAEDSSAATRDWARGLVASLARIGANLNYAPVVDLNVNPDSRAIGKLGRSFSADPDVVVSNATEEIQAHRAAGVKTVLKHFPGLGSAAGNTDFEVVDVSDTWQERELEPFQRLIQAGVADSVMAAHVLNRQLDPAYPASLSTATVTDLLRGRLGWRGPVVSDDMQAVAITDRYGAAAAVALALQAGLDLLVFANQQVYNPRVVDETVDTIMGLVRTGRISEDRIDQSVTRVDSLRPKR
ncbi:glycoside hydrolase family 3 N-terminal domain-containing protein [Micromonospora soli]|uniref:glycoside hydrolase family 3 N-terminal domain-containing protein n=1 Tax=Micromonospora sp. NBRC 110009 TaxID=3061627 RepID=UPI0026736403|nr:glycoside hydrolase family 3 N-terminal domain-containing protein [Micromonospora sp. NBRC 110009]WKT98450.1 glycoside hydrolase family 3 N-terminal domain-containing protein [Micromonospora sp. NBRC 110009]